MNVLQLYVADGFKPRKASPREWHGPCPGCGGNDRFCIYPEQGSELTPGMGSFHCGHGRGGVGCGKGGDAIQYLIDFHGMGFKSACAELGLEGSTQPPSAKYRPPPARAPKRPVGELQPVTWGWPDELEYPDIWQDRGMRFVDHCHQALLERPLSITYLALRGIDQAAIEKYRLGFHVGEVRKDKEYQPAFRELSTWGLRSVKRDTGRPGMLMLPAGFVIPLFTDRGLRRIRIRLAVPDTHDPKKKYHNVKGSTMELWHTGAGREVQTVVETDLDAIMLEVMAGDITGVISLGSVAMQPDGVVHPILQRAHTIIDALDYDAAAVNPVANWSQWYSQHRRWPVPVGKDPGEAYEQGLDLRAWLIAALPPGLQTGAGCGVLTESDDSQKNFFAQCRGGGGEKQNNEADDEKGKAGGEQDGAEQPPRRVVTLKDGREFVLAGSREEWNAAVAAGGVAFTGAELDRLRPIFATMGADERKAGTALVMDVKEVFSGAYISGNRVDCEVPAGGREGKNVEMIGGQ